MDNESECFGTAQISTNKNSYNRREKKWDKKMAKLDFATSGKFLASDQADVVFLAAAVLLCMESVYDILKMLINFYEQNQKAL